MKTKNSRNDLSRRAFIKASAAAGIFAATSAYGNKIYSLASERPVRLGIIGLGKGMSMLKTALTSPGVQIPVVCDIIESKVAMVQRLVEEAGQQKPKGFTGKDDWKRICELNELDAIYTLTLWNLHTWEEIDKYAQEYDHP